jgi:hypothetical protein
LERLAEDRGIPVSFPKPKWLIEDEKNLKLAQKPKPSFVFPVPIVENSGKIRKRKPKVYRKISYNLP